MPKGSIMPVTKGVWLTHAMVTIIDVLALQLLALDWILQLRVRMIQEGMLPER
jgi:hypothetical protein